MLNKKWQIILVVAVVVLVLVLVVAYLVFFRGDGKGPDDLTTNMSVNNNIPGQQLPGGNGQQPSTGQPDEIPVVITETDRQQNEVKNRTKFFVEMLGSYSPEALFQNVTQLQPMMTNKMKDWSEEFVSSNLSNVRENNERVTTHVFRVDILSYSTSEARVLAQARRDKTDDSGHKLYNQEVEIRLIKTNNEWLVDEAAWR